MLKCLILCAVMAGSSDRNVIDYYEGRLKPKDDSARVMVNSELDNPQNKYTRSVALFLSGYLL